MLAVCAVPTARSAVQRLPPLPRSWSEVNPRRGPAVPVPGFQMATIWYLAKKKDSGSPLGAVLRLPAQTRRRAVWGLGAGDPGESAA